MERKKRKNKPLWVIFCHLPEKGTKETEEIVGKMKERDREEREETEEITRNPQKAMSHLWGLSCKFLFALKKKSILQYSRN